MPDRPQRKTGKQAGSGDQPQKNVGGRRLNLTELKAIPEAEIRRVEATCDCGSGVPVQTVQINNEMVTLIALPIFFERLHKAGRRPEPNTITELLQHIQIYNPIPLGLERAYRDALMREYTLYCQKQDVVA